MSIIERPVEREVEVLTEREHRARILEAAALEVAVCGLVQGKACDDEGRVCLMRAIDVTLPTEPMDWLAVMFAWDPDWRGQWPGWGQATKLPLAAWNDEDGRTSKEVTDLLRWRASEIRDGR